MPVNFKPANGAKTTFVWMNGKPAGTGHFTDVPLDHASLEGTRRRYIGDNPSPVMSPDGSVLPEDLFFHYSTGALRFVVDGENLGPLGVAMRLAALDPANPWGMKPEGNGHATIREIQDAAATDGLAILKAYPAPGETSDWPVKAGDSTDRANPTHGRWNRPHGLFSPDGGKHWYFNDIQSPSVSSGTPQGQTTPVVNSAETELLRTRLADFKRKAFELQTKLPRTGGRPMQKLVQLVDDFIKEVTK